MLTGAGRHRLSGSRFRIKGDLGPAPEPRRTGEFAGKSSAYSEQAFGGIGVPGSSGGAVPANTTIRSFAKPTSVGLNIGLISNDPHQVIMLAREIYDNDGLLGAVVDTLAGIPFGAFSLSGVPREVLHPYEVSLDRIRAKTLMPVLCRSHLVDGAFLGSGLFDENQKVWDAIVPQDLLHSTVTPVPFFGATPIIDVQMQNDVMRSLRSGDERMQRYLKYMPVDMLQGGVIKLEPDTFYVPHRALAHMPLGVSMYRKVMIVYLLEKALARGTIEMAYRRQRAMTHIVAGDENWDPSIADMKELADLFMSADLDPLGAFVVTRPGVQPSEMGGMSGDMFRWTDVYDVLSSMKLKGMAMPDGLLGGDLALDSVSATLTVFINMTRQIRDEITRLFFYEKFFPYIAVTNGHRKDHFKDFKETGHFHSRASDLEVDMEDFITPMIQWHTSMRPEGDAEYLNLLMTASQQFQVPVPIRIACAAVGFDVDDLINSSKDDIALREKLAEYQATIQGINQAAGLPDPTGQMMPMAPAGGGAPGGGGDMGGGDMGGGDDGGGFEGGNIHEAFAPFKKKGVFGRQYDEKLAPRNIINGHVYHMTANERARVEEKQNRLIAKTAAAVARRINKSAR